MANPSCVELLLDHGADPWAPFYDSSPSYARGHNACKMEQISIKTTAWRARNTREVEHTGVLFSSSARQGTVSIAFWERSTAMHHFALEGNVKAIKACLDKKIKLPPNALEVTENMGVRICFFFLNFGFYLLILFNWDVKYNVLHAACSYRPAGNTVSTTNAMLDYLEFVFKDNPQKISDYLNAPSAYGITPVIYFLANNPQLDTLKRFVSLGTIYIQICPN